MTVYIELFLSEHNVQRSIYMESFRPTNFFFFFFEHSTTAIVQRCTDLCGGTHDMASFHCHGEFIECVSTFSLFRGTHSNTSQGSTHLSMAEGAVSLSLVGWPGRWHPMTGNGFTASRQLNIPSSNIILPNRIKGMPPHKQILVKRNVFLRNGTNHSETSLVAPSITYSVTCPAPLFLINQPVGWPRTGPQSPRWLVDPVGIFSSRRGG